MVKVERSITINAPISLVWEFFSTQEGLRAWWESDLEIDFRIGGKYRHVDNESKTLITGEVLEIEPLQKIVLSWFEDGPDTDWVNPIRFSFELQQIPEGTFVTFVKDGFEQIGKPTWERTFQAYERGAERHQLLERLKQLAEALYDSRA